MTPCFTTGAYLGLAGQQFPAFSARGVWKNPQAFRWEYNPCLFRLLLLPLSIRSIICAIGSVIGRFHAIGVLSLTNIIQDENWAITTKKGNGKLPLFCGNGERVIPIYDCRIHALEIGVNQIKS